VDTGEGHLAPLSEEKFKELTTKRVDGVFSVGEILEIKGSRFKVHAFRAGKKMILKILPEEVSNG